MIVTIIIKTTLVLLFIFTYRRIEFGKQDACHLVIVASAQHIAVWNILSLTLIWSVPLNVTTLTADPKSTYMAVFTTDNSCKFTI